MTSDQLQVGQSPYRAFITREPFLFYEMRVTAKLLSQGASDEEALRQIMDENLFQYPTEKTIRRIARACMIPPAWPERRFADCSDCAAATG